MFPNESFYIKQKGAFYCFHSNKNILKSHFCLIRGKTVKLQGNFNYIKMAFLDLNNFRGKTHCVPASPLCLHQSLLKLSNILCLRRKL